MLCSLSAPVCAQTDIIDNVLLAVKDNFKSNVTPDFRYLYALLATDKINDKDYQFLIPQYDDLDVKTASVSDLSNAVISSFLQGKMPNDTYVKELSASQLPDGSFDTDLTVNAYCAVALRLSQLNKMDCEFDVDNFLTFLRSQQSFDGRFSDIQTTGAIMSALSLFDKTATFDILKSCAQYMANRLNSNGSIQDYNLRVNVISQSMAIVGLTSVGYNFENDVFSKVDDYLLKFMTSNNLFSFSVGGEDDILSTMYALLALSELKLGVIDNPQVATTTKSTTSKSTTKSTTTTTVPTTEIATTQPSYTLTTTTTNNNTTKPSYIPTTTTTTTTTIMPSYTTTTTAGSGQKPSINFIPGMAYGGIFNTLVNIFMQNTTASSSSVTVIKTTSTTAEITTLSVSKSTEKTSENTSENITDSITSTTQKPNVETGVKSLSPLIFAVLSMSAMVLLKFKK